MPSNFIIYSNIMCILCIRHHPGDGRQVRKLIDYFNWHQSINIFKHAARIVTGLQYILHACTAIYVMYVYV